MTRLSSSDFNAIIIITSTAQPVTVVTATNGVGQILKSGFPLAAQTVKYTNPR